MEEKDSSALPTQEKKLDEVNHEGSAAPAVSTKSSTKSEKFKFSNISLSSVVSSSSSGSEYSDSCTQNSLTTTATPSVSATKS